jgi:hypothetical protein
MSPSASPFPALGEFGPGRVPGPHLSPTPFVGSRPELSGGFLPGWNLSRRKCRPERIVWFVLADLLADWGYENDRLDVSDVLARLRIMCIGQVFRLPIRAGTAWLARVVGALSAHLTPSRTTPKFRYTQMHRFRRPVRVVQTVQPALIGDSEQDLEST